MSSPPLDGVDRSRLPPLRPVPRFTFPSVAKSTLANGLRVWTAHHDEVPITEFLLIFRHGASIDPVGREGLTAFTTDLLDEGTGSMSAIDVSEELARIGAQLGVDVGADAIFVGVSTLTRFSERSLRLLADIVVRPSLREDDFERVRRQRLNRLVQLRDLPGAIAERVFMRLLYGDAPYGHTPLGREASLTAMTLDDVRDFHRGTFRPGDVTHDVVGD